MSRATLRLRRMPEMHKERKARMACASPAPFPCGLLELLASSPVVHGVFVAFAGRYVAMLYVERHMGILTGVDSRYTCGSQPLQSYFQPALRGIR